MCGRYYIDDVVITDLLNDQTEVNKFEKLHAGEIFPSEDCLVQTNRGYDVMHWGLVFEGMKKELINARSETIIAELMGTKKTRTFKDDYMERRCVIICSSFYEWKVVDGKKVKHTYTTSDNPMYLAGFYKTTKKRDEFVIITKEAPEEVKEIHDRVPVILDKDQVDEYIKSGTINFLTIPSPEFFVK